MTDSYRIRSDETWARARADYLAGKSAEIVCRRYDLGVSALRWRARRDGWRRCDEADPAPVDDDDLRIFEDVETDDLAEMARLRMVAAVSRGQATQVLRWRRIHETFQREASALAAWLAEDRAEAEAIRAARAAAAAPDSSPRSDAGDDATPPDSDGAKAIIPPVAAADLHDLHSDFSTDAPPAPLSRLQRRQLERRARKRS